MIYHGDLFDVLLTLADESIDACVTDPPYELGFMGKHWDTSGIAYNITMWREVLRVLKPGAHLLAFGGTRTYHRMTCAIEDAGFEIRDSLAWLHGQGFPKSLDIGKAAGIAREVVGRGNGAATSNTNSLGVFRPEYDMTVPATNMAKKWHGWGTALKPAFEPIVLARKPFKGSVRANVEQHGTGALNIDACRIDAGGETWEREPGTVQPNASIGTFQTGARSVVQHDLGRWPANVALDEIAALVLDEQSGDCGGGNGDYDWGESNNDNPVNFIRNIKSGAHFGDSGGASRFYYVAKPSREERDYGCEGLAPRTAGECTDRREGSDGLKNPRAGAGRTGGGRNFHPTVKPVELMRWLVKLVTPINGTVLDPFMGSGTTGMACALERREFIGIEREAEYIQIARCRIAATVPLFADNSAQHISAVIQAEQPTPEAHVEAQGSLWDIEEST